MLVLHLREQTTNLWTFIIQIYMYTKTGESRVSHVVFNNTPTFESCSVFEPPVNDIFMSSLHEDLQTSILNWLFVKLISSSFKHHLQKLIVFLRSDFQTTWPVIALFTSRYN